jgi:hypothetical protein
MFSLPNLIIIFDPRVIVVQDHILYQLMVFDCKFDGERKERFVAAGDCSFAP